MFRKGKKTENEGIIFSFVRKMTSTIYRFKGKELKIPTDGSYLNLKTGRTLGSTSKMLKELTCIKFPHVCGTNDMIEEFQEENKKTVKSNRTVSSALAMASLAMGAKPTEETKKIINEKPDITKINQSQGQQIPRFSLTGIETQVLVISVKDADTFDVAFYYEYPGFKGEGKSWILMRDDVRLYGIDSAEKKGDDKSLGLQASQKVKDMVKKNNNYLWAKFREFDKYGRILADMWLDEDRKKSLNEEILQLKCETTGVCLVNTYFGGKKEGFAAKSSSDKAKPQPKPQNKGKKATEEFEDEDEEEFEEEDEDEEEFENEDEEEDEQEDEDEEAD
jgi:endonuclease YncB( thermonuclease family)